MKISQAATAQAKRISRPSSSALPDDEQDHAQIHRAAHETIRATLDEPLRRRPGRRRPPALEHEARRRLEHERRTGYEEDPAEHLQRERLLVRLPAREEPRHDPRDDHRPADEDEARAAEDGAEPRR